MVQGVAVERRVGLQVREERVDLGSLVRAAVRSRGWDDRVSVDGSEVVLQSDHRRLERIASNLIGNALEHGGRDVTARIGRDGVGSFLEVSDRGAGIPPDRLSHVFDRFYKADTARPGPGSGLGLLRRESRSTFATPRPLDELPAWARARLAGDRLLTVTKTHARSPVHRRVHMEDIGIRQLDAAGRVASLAEDGIARRLRVQLPAELMPFVVERGSIAMAGVSLTVAALGEDWVEVSLIPETLERTNLGELQEGEEINVECDLLARYVRRQSAGVSPLPTESE